MYTIERNIQILIALLKEHGIRKCVVSPGTCNASFVFSIQRDPFFQVYSCIDERSAAYIACGMSSETNEAVVLSCTGATASRNYLPGLTEAYYRKLPILAITSLETQRNVGQLLTQQIDRSIIAKDAVIRSYYIPKTTSPTDEIFCQREINSAILSLTNNGGGPVHINIEYQYIFDFEALSLPKVNVVKRYSYGDEFPSMPQGRIAIVLGAHKDLSEEETDLIDHFCRCHNAFVNALIPSCYYGAYGVNTALLFSQVNYCGGLNEFDLLIHIGEISLDGIGYQLKPKQVWRVSEDGEVKDRYGKLSAIFKTSITAFFTHYISNDEGATSFYQECSEANAKIRSLIPEIPFSNCWIAQYLSTIIYTEFEVFLGIANSARAWSYSSYDPKLHVRSNTGGYGIDGCLSSMIGASLAYPLKHYLGIIGDLAFFYDMNVLGNRHIGNNLHIIIINNDGGQQFRNFDHMASTQTEYVNEFVAASGHFRSSNLIEDYANDLGFKYYKADSKSSFFSIIQEFLRKDDSSKIIEVITESKNENYAIQSLRSIMDFNSDFSKTMSKQTFKRIKIGWKKNIK